MIIKKRWAVLMALVFTLAACHSKLYDQSEGNVADVKIKATQSRQKFDALGKQRNLALKVNQGLYVDTSPVNLERCPPWLKNRIVISGDQLPFSYYSRTIGSGAGSNILTKYQIGLDPSTNVSLNYAGTVKGALDLLASKTGYVYTIEHNRIYWQAFITRTFDVAFMPGASDYLMGKTSSGGTGASTSNSGTSGTVSNYVSSDSSENEYSNLSGKLSIWQDLDNTIKQLLSDKGKVTVSQATTSVTVHDKPTNVELIGKYINNLNHNLSKQVLVKVQVLEITLENDYDFGINWQLIVKAFHNSPFVVNANYGTPISIKALTSQAGSLTVPQFGTQGNGKNPSYTILMNALNQQGKTSIVTEPRVLCMNNQVSVIRIVTQNGYVASVQNTTLAGAGAGASSLNTVTSQITPGTVITGLTLYILPKILNDNVFLQLNADLSTNDGFDTFTAGTAASATSSSGGAATGPSTSVQLPNITEKHFNQRSVIHSGDTLILSGFKQVINRANANQFLTVQALGGKAAQQQSKETIVLITPYVLPGSA